MSNKRVLLNYLTLNELISRDSIWNKILNFVGDRETKVYLVGGYLRDLLLGIPSLDIDLVTEEESLSYAQDLAACLQGSSFLLDEANQISRVAIKEDSRRSIDISTYEDEITSDLKRRDFTVNSLALDLTQFIAKGRADFPTDLIDISTGWSDLENSIIRVTGPLSFRQDPIRLLRALRLSRVLNFKLEEGTTRAIKTDSQLLRGVASERVRNELFLIFALPNSANVLRLADRLGLLKAVIEEVEDLKEVEQNGYHHLDVWNHSLLTVEMLEVIVSQLSDYFGSHQAKVMEYFKQEVQVNITRLSLLKFAALLHDLAKPKSKFIDDKGRIRFFGHAKLSAEMAEVICKRLRLGKKASRIVYLAIKAHMRPGFLAQSFTERARYRLLVDLDEDIISVCVLSLADRLAAQGPLSNQELLGAHKKLVTELVDMFLKRQRKPVKKKRLLTGDDLIKEFGLLPGPQIGKLLGELEEAALKGKVGDRESALKFVASLLKKDKH